MATDTGKVKATSGSKSEAFVSQQLAAAERRIRLLDLTTAILGFVAGTFAYAVLMVLVDRTWHLSSGLRQLALIGYFVAAAFYLGWTVVRPLTRRINPYFAARKVEETLPGAKNSVINWVDLHDQQLSPVIRSAINHRAARDVARADMDKAVSDLALRAGIVGGVAAACAGLVVILFILFGPRQFSSLFWRAFAPFDAGTRVAPRTALEMISPKDGNATVLSGRAVSIEVQVNGRVPEPGKPDAVKLYWRYDPRDAYQVRPLQPRESAREWATVLNAADVRDGFWYKITGGDDATEEYKVTVRSTPGLTSFQATYTYRPYVGRLPEVRRGDRKIEALRGTDVTLVVHTNRDLRSAQLDLDTRNGKKTIPGRLAAIDPQTFQVQFVLDETGLYRLSFVSTEDETYTDPLLYQVSAVPDRAPEVSLTKPGQDIHLPANALLQVEGKARDDIGVQALTLQMKMIGAGPPLRGKVYRADQGGLKLPSGGYPLSVEYKDFVDLAQIKTTEGKPYTLHPGMELEYWLEARDACDYLQPNVTQSKHFRVQIDALDDAKKQQQRRQQAQQDKKDHDARENEQRKKEDQERQEQKKKEEQEKRDQAAKDAGGQDKNDNPPDDGQKKPGDQGQPGNENPGQDRDKETRDKADQINKQLDKDQQKQGNDANPGQEDKGQPKDDKPGGESKPGAGNQGQGDNKAEDKKDGPQGNQKPQQKDGAGKDGKDGQAAGKDGGKLDGKPDNMGENKGGDGKGGEPQGQAAEGKDGGQADKQGTDQANKPAEGKGTAPKDGAQQAGDPKQGGEQGDGNQSAEAKDGGKDGDKGEGAGAAGKNKDLNLNGAGSEAKDAGTKDGDKGEGKAVAKGGEKKDGNGSQGSGKPGTAQGKAQDLVQGNGKPDPDQHPPTDAEMKDLERLARQLQSPNRERREEAANELEQIKDKAKDQGIQDLASKMMDQLRKNAGNQAAQDKPAQGGQDPTQPPTEEEKKKLAQSKGDAGPEGGQPKGDDGKGPMDRGTPKDGKEGDTGKDPMAMGPQEGDGKPNGDGKAQAKNRGAPQPGQAPNVSGSGGKTQRGKEPPKDGPDTPLRKDPTDPLSRRATEAQLEEFKKMLDKKALERLKMTEEAREKFLKNYAELIKRDQARTDKAEVPAAPQPGVNLPSTASQRPNVAGNGPTDDTTATDSGKAPPGYRDDYNEFQRLLLPPAKKPVREK